MKFIRQLEYKLRVTLSLDQRSSRPGIRIQGLKQDVSKAEYEIRGRLFSLNAGLLEHKQHHEVNDQLKRLAEQQAQIQAKKAADKRENELIVAKLVCFICYIFYVSDACTNRIQTDWMTCVSRKC